MPLLHYFQMPAVLPPAHEAKPNLGVFSNHWSSTQSAGGV